jgi:hypothetical protein
MRPPLLGLLLASTLLASTSLSARTALADPPPAPLAPYAAAPAYPAQAAPWATPLAGTRRRSPAAMVGGILLTSLGAIGMALGTGVYVDAASCADTNVAGTVVRTNCPNRSGGKLFGMTMLLGSASGAALGVPLWIYGAEKVAALPEDAAPIRAAVVVGPASGGFRVLF